tara:strand:+ start:16860 stop:17414 length:555 start_codon:yes stop_codon:yes gene_type:complete
MKPNDLETLFKDLQAEFNIEQPAKNHEERFLAKLNKQSANHKPSGKIRKLWLPILSIAASIVLLVSLAIGTNSNSDVTGLASVSPEMAKTESFFTATISAELKKLEASSNNETRLLIKDAMVQLNRLEAEYKILITDLIESGQDQRVIYAMISNFQNRIEVLENTLKQIEHIKELNNNLLEKTL